MPSSGMLRRVALVSITRRNLEVDGILQGYNPIFLTLSKSELGFPYLLQMGLSSQFQSAEAVSEFQEGRQRREGCFY
jgi:hypothetical protein